MSVNYELSWKSLVAIVRQRWQEEPDESTQWVWEEVLGLMEDIIQNAEDNVEYEEDETRIVVDYPEWTLDELVEGAKLALPGAPTPLVQLCAGIAWSVLNGFKPKDERVIDVEAIKFLQKALEAEQEPLEGPLGVTSSIK